MHPWSELIIRLILTISLFFYLLSINISAFPIIELGLIIVLSAFYHFAMNGFQIADINEYIPSNRVKLLAKGIYITSFIILCHFIPYFFLFLPVLFYDIQLELPMRVTVLVLLTILGFILNLGIFTCLFIGGLSLISSFLRSLILTSAKQETKFFSEINELSYMNQRFKEEQQHLVALQNERIQSSINTERRRLVGEIHDLLGHQLSSVIIQLGALQYMVDDDDTKATLAGIKELLNTSMENVRAVIHTERDSTVDLEKEIQHLIDHFTKAKVHFTYRNECSLDTQMAHSVVNIVKEALTNINKHSDAKFVTIRFLELETQWSLLISDDGTKNQPSTKKDHQTGIGLLNIEERVHQLGGNLHINHEKGFRIFITIPKKKVD